MLTTHSDLHSYIYQYEEGEEVHFSETEYLAELTFFTCSLFACRLSDLSKTLCEMLSHLLNKSSAYHTILCFQPKDCNQQYSIYERNTKAAQVMK